MRYGVPVISLPDWRIPNIFSVVFGSRHKSIGLALVLILAGISFFEGYSFSANSLLADTSAAQVVGANEIKSNIAYKVLQPMAAEVVSNSSSNMLTAGSGVLLNETPVFTSRIAGRLRSDVTFYAVKSGETLSGIAKKFDISTGTLIWANKIRNRDSLDVGQNLMILPVSGVLHKVAPGESIRQIAKKYKASTEKTVAFNDLLDTQKLEAGMLLIVPGGVKALPKRRVAVSSGSAWNSWATSEFRGVRVIGGFPIQPWSSHFGGGYCTSYVQYVKGYIPWTGNANAWYSNAAGYAPRGSKAKVGAIYVEPAMTAWGHVSVVERVNSDGSFLVSDGNYIGYGIASERTITKSTGLFIYY